MDPDHGMFAHQSTQFDTHAGSPEHPMTVDVGRRGGRVTITSSTPGAACRRINVREGGPPKELSQSRADPRLAGVPGWRFNLNWRTA